MMALLQRVRCARVEVAGQVIGEIDAGLLVLLCAERGDTAAICDKMLAKMLKLRIFSDAAGKMNHSLQDSSRWPPTPRVATGPGLPLPPRPMKAAAGLTMCLSRRAKPTRWCRAVRLVPTCRCTWSMTARSRSRCVSAPEPQGTG